MRDNAPEAQLIVDANEGWTAGEYRTLAPVFADRGRLKLKGLAFLALAYEPFGETAQHTLLLDEIAKRVSEAAVEVDGAPVSRIGRGLLVLLGVERGDGDAQAPDADGST